MIAGIDPGKTGAYAVLYDDGRLLAVRDNEETGDCRLRPSSCPVRLVAIERVHSMPKQGVASSFRFGCSFGWWRGWCDAHELPRVEPTPAKWQKAVLDSIPRKGDIKNVVWEFARRRWPDAELTGPRGAKLYGRADALCLAEYARLTARCDLARG